MFLKCAVLATAFSISSVVWAVERIQMASAETLQERLGKERLEHFAANTPLVGWIAGKKLSRAEAVIAVDESILSYKERMGSMHPMMASIIKDSVLKVVFRDRPDVLKQLCKR